MITCRKTVCEVSSNSSADLYMLSNNRLEVVNIEILFNFVNWTSISEVKLDVKVGEMRMYRVQVGRWESRMCKWEVEKVGCANGGNENVESASGKMRK